MPPQVHPEKMNMTVKQNDTILIPCNATGIPEPTIEWFKEPNIKIIGGVSTDPHHLSREIPRELVGSFQSTTCPGARWRSGMPSRRTTASTAAWLRTRRAWASATGSSAWNVPPPLSPRPPLSALPVCPFPGPSARHFGV